MQRLFGISIIVLALGTTAAFAVPGEASITTNHARPVTTDSLLGLTGDALFEQLGVPSQLESAGHELETWSFGDGALLVSLVSDQVIQVRGELPEDFERTERPDEGYYQAQPIGETVQQLGEPLEVLIGSNSLTLRFEGEREFAIVGPRGRIAY